MGVQLLLDCFNPRSRMESDLRSGERATSPNLFQSTLPHGERPQIDFADMGLAQFQSTLPHGERPGPSVNVELPVLVSIHAPAWRATHNVGQKGYWYYVSIHAPAWGATLRDAGRGRCRPVSIHAPVRGATNIRGAGAFRGPVSIHAPVRGATNKGVVTVGSRRFQSTPPCGGRLRPTGLSCPWSSVSIHAPVRGATFQFMFPSQNHQ